MGEIIPQHLIDRIKNLGKNVEDFVRQAIEEKIAKNNKGEGLKNRT